MQAWDGYDAYLFDIDGTLLQCTDAVHYFAFLRALQALAGRPLTLDGVVAHGNTDVGILRDALRLANVPEEEWRPRLAETRAGMCCYVDEHKDQLCAQVLPQVVNILQHLRSRGAALGVATGNLEKIGKLKLEHCGLSPFFSFGGYSDDYESRSDVFANALATAQTIAGAGATVCVVGDTPSDIEAAHANGVDAIAVATGIYSLQRLALGRPEWCVPELGELLATPTRSLV